MNNKLTQTKFPFSLLLIILTCVLLLGSGISLSIGQIQIPIREIWQTLIGQGSPENRLTILEFRLSRTVMSILVGMGISLSGAILQGVSKNSLADPGILGINAGAGFAVVLYNYFFSQINTISGILFTYLLPIVALIGAFVATILIYSIAYRKGNISISKMLLVGIGINAAFNAGITLFSLKMNPNDFQKTLTWLSGSIWSSGWSLLFFILPILILSIPLVLRKAKTLDIIALNDITAVGVGISLNREKKKFLFLAVLLAGSCVAIGGGITFLGLLGPHISKKLVGHSHARILPLSIFSGAILVLFSDIVARILIAPAELPVGIVISFIGVPYFLYLLFKR